MMRLGSGKFVQEVRWRLLSNPPLRIVANRAVLLIFGLIAAFLFMNGAFRGTLKYPGAAFVGLVGVAGLSYALVWRRWPRFGRTLGIIANLAGVGVMTNGLVGVSPSEWYAIPLVALTAVCLFGIPLFDLARPAAKGVRT
jgi:hypothetical protein